MDYQYPLSPRTSLRLGGHAKDGLELTSEELVVTAVNQAKQLGQKLMILGGGTNTVFADGHHDLIIGQMQIDGLRRDDTLITAGAGVAWDDLVKFALSEQLAGVEALTAIPGTVGAAPVQNIGAYGAELSDIFHCLRAYDTTKNQFVELNKTDCNFGYRHSRFKTEPGRFVITQVTLALTPASNPVPIPDYPGVKDYLVEHQIKSPSLADLSQAIAAIRWSKLPKPADLPNAGSFFENPVVSAAKAKTLQQIYPAIRLFPLANNQVKIPAGWLIEQAGLKGARVGGLGTYEKNALVIVNHGDGTYAELEALIAQITAAIHAKFGLTLKPEVNIVKC